MRNKYGVLLVILIVCLIGFTGCLGNGSAEVMSNGQSAVEEETVVEHTFIHHRFVDKIYMTLPSGWTYSTYEKLNAGDEMESHEWGFTVYIEGNEAGKITVSGSYETEEPEGEAGTDFITNTGLLGKRYRNQGMEDTEEAVVEEYISLTIPGFDYAYYVVTCTVSRELYLENKEILESFLLNVGVTAAPLE